MAELNFGLLTPPGSENIGNAFLRGQDQARAAQMQDMQMQQSMRQGQREELQYRKAQNAEDKLNQFYAHVADNGGPKDPVAIEDAMMKSGVPNVADAGLAARMARLRIEQSRVQDREAMGLPSAGVAVSPVAPTAPASPLLPSFGGGNQLVAAAGALPVAAPTNAMIQPDKQAAINAAKQKMLSANPGVRDAGKMELEQLTKPGVQHVVGDKLIGADGRVIYEGAFKPAPPPSMVAEYTFAKTPDGGGFRGSFQDFVKERAAAARPPAQPRPEQPAQAVVDPDTGKQILVSREEAIRRRMTPANAVEGLAPKEIQKREAALPAATSAVNGFETKSKSFVKDLEALRDHPGLASITGIAAGRLPGLTSDGRAAQALYDKIVAKGGFQALQDLRDASKTGGALGNVSNQEGKQLTASFAAIDRRQDAADVKAAIDQAISDVNGARTRTREAYDSTYSYKNAASQAAPAGAGKPSLDSIFGKKNP